MEVMGIVTGFRAAKDLAKESAPTVSAATTTQSSRSPTPSRTPARSPPPPPEVDEAAERVHERPVRLLRELLGSFVGLVPDAALDDHFCSVVPLQRAAHGLGRRRRQDDGARDAERARGVGRG